MTQMDLGVSFKKLSNAKDKKENLLNAIECYNNALKVYNINEFPHEYAVTQKNFGISCEELSYMCNKNENLAKAIDCLEEASRAYKTDEFRTKYDNEYNEIQRKLKELKDKIEK